MRLLSRCRATALLTAVAAAAAWSGEAALAATPSSELAVVPGSYTPTTDIDTGEYSSPSMTVQVVLAPSNQAQLSALLTQLYDSSNASYQQWLGAGEFYSQFAPSNSQITEISNYLQAGGLVVEPSSSPFLLRASGSSSAIAAALGTSLHNYRNANGVAYFTNAAPVQLPANLTAGVLGVVGLSNTVRMHSLAVLPHKHASPPPSCETPYPTAAQFVAFYIDGTSFPFGYGQGPGCNGLTPSQTNSIYGAPNVGQSGEGHGVNLAVFELSAYRRSDIETWARYFYGPAYAPPLVDITVDGGPLAPICPSGDSCPPQYNGYNGDIEVVADIQMQLSISPAAQRILVYNAPNDYSGQTELDEYARIAKDDMADVISSSWSVCENDVSTGYVQAENLIFEQMAAQGQSMFGAAGDSGAFECITTSGTSIIDTYLNALDPPSQPWVTSVGGTSFDAFNPGLNTAPSYPEGIETVWNPDNLCNTSANSYGTGASGYSWCLATGAGGGGYSQYWGRPFYQHGAGLISRYTAYGNGTTQCALAPRGAPCREVPDVSANADEYTPYAEYCTGNPNPPDYSTCGSFSGGQTPPGWFGIGGTSLASPLWSAIIANRVSFSHGRVGNVNPLLYGLYNSYPQGYFHDITGIGQTTNNNGFFPATPGYDQATGIGTPKMSALITEVPQP